MPVFPVLIPSRIRSFEMNPSPGMKTILPTLLLILLMTPPAPGQSPPVEIDYERARLERNVRAVRIIDEIFLDGLLDEAAWDLAVPAADFLQHRPVVGIPAGEPTEVRFLFDDENLYIGVICFDSQPDRIAVNDLEEDFNFMGSDLIAIALDSLHDLQTAFVFRTNAAGAKGDAQISPSAGGGGFNNDWDGVWDVRSTRNDEGWTAEFVIPFKTLRFSTAESQVWGLNVNRRILRLNEEDEWSPTPIRYDLGRVSQYGTLLGLENLRPGRNLKVTPFVTAGLTQIRPSGDPNGDFENDPNYDGGVDVKYGLTPSITLDATYRTDFAQVEVDQQQVNLTRFNLFFPEQRDFFIENASTFSFGADSNVVPFFSRRIGLSSSGTPIPIVGGGRVTGQSGRYDLGFLAMKTERQDAVPSNNYFAGRVKRNLMTNSWVGALLTHRNSRIENNYNRVYGADARFQFFDRLDISSHIMRSETPGRSGNNQARQFQASWRDDELIAMAGYTGIQSDFNPELGFVRRRNHSRYSGEFSWNPLIESSTRLRNFVVGTRLDYFENGTTNQIETREAGVDLGMGLEDGGSLDFGLLQTFDRLTDPFQIRKDISIPEGDYRYLAYTARFSTNPGRKLSGNSRADWGEFWNGRRRSLAGGLTWRPDYHLRIGLNYTRNQVNLANGAFTTDLLGARFLYAISATTSLNAFFQYNADTQQVSSNIRFNVIHNPLSDFFLVYNDLRDTHSGQLLQRAVILKFTNLFNF